MKHASTIDIGDDALAIKCVCGWTFRIVQEYDRYEGYVIPVTMEQLWSVWTTHLGAAQE